MRILLARSPRVAGRKQRGQFEDLSLRLSRGTRMREPGASAPLDERDPRRPHPCPPSCRDVFRSGGKLGFLGLPEILRTECRQRLRWT